jgi:hypothetical protein
MIYKELLYGSTLIPSKPEAFVISEMKECYKRNGTHIVAYFNYAPENLKKEFPLCEMETYESIYWRFRNYYPKEGRKCDVLHDYESLIFPKYSIVDCTDIPVLRGHGKIYNIFVEEEANRFIIFINYQKKKAFQYCGGYGHVLFSSLGANSG